MADFVIQALAAGLLFTGLWKMGDKRLTGPFITALAEGFTTTVGITHHTWSSTLIGVTLFGIQTRNFIKWRKEGARW